MMLAYGKLSREPLTIDTGTFIFRRIAVRGFWRTRWFELAPRAATVAALSQLADLVAEGALVLPVDASYDLADFRDAVAHTHTSGRTGKVLLTG